MRRVALCSMVVLAVASMASAIGLQAVPYVGADTSNTAQGLTPDGKYVVGTSGSANGYVYNTQTGNLFTVDRDTTGRLLNRGTGVGYRTAGGVDQLVVHGATTGVGWMGLWVMDLATEPGASGLWATPAASMWLSSLAEAVGTGTGTYNTLAMEGLGSANGYASSIKGNSGAKVKTAVVVQINAASAGYTPTAQAVGATKFVGSGVSTTGLITYGDGHNNWTSKYPAVTGANQTNGLTGLTRGDMFAMAADGSRAFGYDYGAATNAYAFDLDANGNFIATYKLPTPGATSTSTAYGASADGKYAVGKIYQGSKDVAVLWDLTDPNDIKVLNLTGWALQNGVLGTWSQLGRGTSVGVNGSGEIVISGLGTNAGKTQAFVLTIPEPATLSFLALGGLALLRRRTR